MNDGNDWDVEADGNSSLSPSLSPFSPLPIKAAKLSLFFLPSPVTDPTAVDAHPATLSLLPVLSPLSFSLSFSNPPALVGVPSDLFPDVLELGREDLGVALDFRPAEESLRVEPFCDILSPLDSSEDEVSSTFERLDLVDALDRTELDLNSGVARENTCKGSSTREVPNFLVLELQNCQNRGGTADIQQTRRTCRANPTLGSLRLPGTVLQSSFPGPGMPLTLVTGRSRSLV